MLSHAWASNRLSFASSAENAHADSVKHLRMHWWVCRLTGDLSPLGGGPATKLDRQSGAALEKDILQIEDTQIQDLHTM